MYLHLILLLLVVVVEGLEMGMAVVVEEAAAIKHLHLLYLPLIHTLLQLVQVVMEALIHHQVLKVATL
jgi:hypothetical protein